MNKKVTDWARKMGFSGADDPTFQIGLLKWLSNPEVTVVMDHVVNHVAPVDEARYIQQQVLLKELKSQDTFRSHTALKVNTVKELAEQVQRDELQEKIAKVDTEISQIEENMKIIGSHVVERPVCRMKELEDQLMNVFVKIDEIQADITQSKQWKSKFEKLMQPFVKPVPNDGIDGLEPFDEIKKVLSEVEATEVPLYNRDPNGLMKCSRELDAEMLGLLERLKLLEKEKSLLEEKVEAAKEAKLQHQLKIEESIDKTLLKEKIDEEVSRHVEISGQEYLHQWCECLPENQEDQVFPDFDKLTTVKNCISHSMDKFKSGIIARTEKYQLETSKVEPAILGELHKTVLSIPEPDFEGPPRVKLITEPSESPPATALPILDYPLPSVPDWTPNTNAMVGKFSKMERFSDLTSAIQEESENVLQFLDSFKVPTKVVLQKT